MIDSSVLRRFPTIHLKKRRTFTPFTIYLFAGPQPFPPRQRLPSSAPSSLPALLLVDQPVVPLSALDILRQRSARGELDEATFDRMRALLGE
ncbi:MAG TPA: SHOCT domain-containing protein [Ktedonobacteraceae bacterium]|nr:SHOCT domain-containing protein [Ktedonobacteraceae bacterium]